MLLNNKHTLFSKLVLFLDEAKEQTIYAPYIKLGALKKLLDNTNSSCKQIVVRWEPKDLIVGVSDLEVYDFCKEKGITLYWNKRIHLKVYLGNDSAFVTSANISKRALGYEFDERCNHEVGTIVNDLKLEDKIYFQEIINESVLVTDEIVGSLKKQLDEFEKEDTPEEFEIDWFDGDQSFLISSLPMSNNVKFLKNFYFGKTIGLEKIEENCAIHDLALYKIPIGLSESTFDGLLRERFLNHPFIQSFLREIDSNSNGLYFGTVKEWFKNNTTSVPIPRRWELTENVQILYRWIVNLSEGNYLVDRPRHSERITKSRKK